MVTITALNGALPASMLTDIGGGFALRPDAAASYLRARASGAPSGITTAYRTKAEQKRLLDLYGYPRAEYPGKSQHGEGVALDLPEPARSWFVTHGKSHGWIRTVMPTEPWHFEYQPARDTSDSTPTPEDDMPTLQEIDAVVRVAVADEVAKVLRGNEFDLEVTTLPQAIATAVLGAQITRGGLGPAALADWIADGRILAGQAAERTSGGGEIDYGVLAMAVADEQDRRARARLA